MMKEWSNEGADERRENCPSRAHIDAVKSTAISCRELPLAWKIPTASGVMIDPFAGTKIHVARASALAADSLDRSSHAPRNG